MKEKYIVISTEREPGCFTENFEGIFDRRDTAISHIQDFVRRKIENRNSLDDGENYIDEIPDKDDIFAGTPVKYYSNAVGEYSAIGYEVFKV